LTRRIGTVRGVEPGNYAGQISDGSDRELEMTLTDRIRRLLDSPQGKKVVDRGRRELAKPENQRRLQDLLRRLSGRGR
jgi:hypothetical protein